MPRYAEEHKRRRAGVERVTIEEYNFDFALDPVDLALDQETIELRSQAPCHVDIFCKTDLLVKTLPHVLKETSPLNEFSAWLRVFIDEIGYE